MKVKRRKFNVFEQMEIEWLKNTDKGPIEEFILTRAEFEEFRIDAKNRPHVSYQKIVGRTDDDIGGDWKYRGSLIVVEKKKNAT